MTRVGLTGGIASGKTTVADRWHELGAVIVDADVVAREVVEPGTPGLAAIEDRFGASVVTQTGELNRQALGEIVFRDESARADLNAILHPAIRERSQQLAEQAYAADPDAIVVMVIPLLIETGQEDDFDLLVVVDVPVETQLQRVQSRDKLSREQAQGRVAAQASREQRLAAADLVIDNSGNREQLLAEADRVWGVISAGK